MKKQVRLSQEERTILQKLSNDQLTFFDEIYSHKHFEKFIDFVNVLIDQEKNIFFGETEVEPEKLAVLHAFSRGGVGKLIMLLHILAGSKDELLSRKKE